jgi:hypothetical protein
MTPQSPTAVATGRLKEEIDREFPGMGREVLIVAQAMFEAENGSDAYAHATNERRAHYRFLAHAGLLALRSPLQDSQELVERLNKARAVLNDYGFVGRSVEGSGDPEVTGIDDAIARIAKLEQAVADGTASINRSHEAGKEFERRALAAESTPSPRIVELEARIAELEGERDEARHVLTESTQLWRLMNGLELDDAGKMAKMFFDKIGPSISADARQMSESGLGDIFSDFLSRIKIIEARAEAAEHALSTAEARGLERAADAIATISVARGSPETSAHVAQALYDAERAIRSLSPTNEVGE